MGEIVLAENKEAAKLPSKERQAFLKEVQEQRDYAESARREAHEETLRHPRSELHVELPAESEQGRNDKAITLDAGGDFVIIDTHGPARLDQFNAMQLAKQIQKAFQVVA